MAFSNETFGAVMGVLGEVKKVIPNAASADNQLTDKEYVDSSINSSSAFYRGSYATKAALLAISWQTSNPSAANFVSNNDYAYIEADETHNGEVWRYNYKYEPNGVNNGWYAQYKINEAPFSQEQLAAINSGIDSEKVSEIGTIKSAINDPVTGLDNKAPVIIDTASGSIASFPDGADDLPVNDLTIGIDPVQDLHGYDNPWPAGGGKNKFNGASVSTSNTNNWLVTWANNKLTVNHLASYTSGIPISADLGLSAGTYVSSYTSSTPINIDLYKNGAYSKIIRSGDTFTVENGDTVQLAFPNASATSVEYTNIQVESGSSATSYAPYSNICPISGWTGCEVANISDSEKQPYFAGLINGTYGFVDLGTMSWAYNSGAGEKKFFLSQTIPNIKVQGDNYFVWENLIISNGYKKTYAADIYGGTADNKSYAGYDGSAIRVLDTSYTDAASFKTAMSGVYLIYELATPTTPTITQAQYNTLLQSFNLGGWLVPISWQTEAGTVYGGTLDVTTGLLTVTMAEVDLGTLTYSYVSAQRYMQSSYALTAAKAPANNSTKANIICSKLATVSAYNVYSGTSGIGLSDNALIRIIYDGIGTDPVTFATAMTGTTLVYELATPVTYQLTPTKVDLLLGVNNVWADTGDSTVTYRADTKLYIQKINAPTDDDMIADAQIASGKYFIVNNNLYLSTTTILAGDPIKPGTNCTLTNLAAALNALNS